MAIKSPLVLGSSGIPQQLQSGDSIPYAPVSVFYDNGNSGTGTAGTFTINYANGTRQKLTVTGAFTLAISNFPASGIPAELEIQLVNGAAFAVTWPTINWIKQDGTTTTSISSAGITLQSSGTDWIYLWGNEGSSAINGTVIRSALGGSFLTNQIFL